jgi:hypothetical protein
MKSNQNNDNSNEIKKSSSRSFLIIFLIGIGLSFSIYSSFPMIKKISFLSGVISKSFGGPPPKIILYTPKETSKYFSDSGGNYEILLKPWITYFVDSQLIYERTDNLDNLDEEPNSILVLASAVSLNQSDRNKIMYFHKSGGSILTSWSTGTLDESAAWVGWDFLKELGAEFVGESTTKKIGYFVTRGETPVTSSLPAGSRIQLRASNEPILRFKNSESSAVLLLNWDRIADKESSGNSVVVFNEPQNGSGRVVCFGFPETVWEDNPVILYPILDNTINWLKRIPSLIKSAWPNAMQGAQILSMDTEEGFNGSLAFARLLTDRKMPATFFILTSQAKQFPETLEILNRDFELGFHGDIHNSFKGQPLEEQAERIRIMRSDLDVTLTNHRVVKGFRPPFEQYDSSTEEVLSKSGFLYELVDPARTQSRLPFITQAPTFDQAAGLVVLARTQRDDFNLLKESIGGQLNQTKQLTKMLKQDLDMAINNRGLGVLNIHSQNFIANSPLAKAVESYLDTLETKKDQIWIATGGAIAQWWLDRSHVTISTTNKLNDIQLNLTVSGNRPVDRFALIMMVPKRDLTPSVNALKVGIPKVKIEKLDAFRYKILFPLLQPENYQYEITFD